jgi:FMN phosphatase YigB (HAD superfamily)
VRTIVWDVDDVLNDLMRVWLQQGWIPHHPDCRVRYEDLAENPPHGLLGTSLEEYHASLDAFRLSPLYREMTPLPEALEWFRQHGARFRHIALTGTSLVSAPVSAEWVLRRFGRWIRSFHFVPSPRRGQALPRYDDSKQSHLRWLGRGDFLVDDNEDNLRGLEDLGIRGLLVQRPWNRGSLTLAQVLQQLADHD